MYDLVRDDIQRWQGESAVAVARDGNISYVFGKKGSSACRETIQPASNPSSATIRSKSTLRDRRSKVMADEARRANKKR
jgi:hypothetical protein